MHNLRFQVCETSQRLYGSVLPHRAVVLCYVLSGMVKIYYTYVRMYLNNEALFLQKT